MNSITRKVDVVVLGAGGGGYPAAFLLDRAGLQVVMADPVGNLGGECLAEGCIPSKAVREASLVRARADKYPFFGLRGGIPDVDWKGVLAHKDRVQQTRYDQHTEEFKDSGILFEAGRGRILDEKRVEIETGDGPHRYEFRDLIVATGAHPHRLKIPGAELAITSHDLFRLGADLPFPRQMVVIGGGYIGVEVASMLNNFGAQAIVLEYTAQLLPGFDPELAETLRSSLSQRVHIELEAEVTEIKSLAAGLQVGYRQHGQERWVTGDTVLMATGREVVLPEGIENLGLSVSGHLVVDNMLRTEKPHVYAPGDVNGRSMLFHSAVQQSLVAAHGILAGGLPAERMDFESVPYTVFTEPELAGVGLTEAQARDRCGAVEVVRYDYATDGRAQIFGETQGFIKLVFESRTSRLLGAQIAGLDAAQLIPPLALAVSQGLGAAALTNVAFPHPMISEGINKAARKFRP